MIRVTDKNYWMEQKLANNLNTAVYNMKNDWDFVCVITGSGLVRIGKSVLAQQVGYYVSYYMETPFSIDNVVFSGDELIKLGHKLPKNSVIIYDEARAELDSKKSLAKVTKVLLDFFAECGMYNHFIIIVLPDFFELNRRIALTRSSFLLNVYKGDEVKSVDDVKVLKYLRGGFEFYDRKRKKKFFIIGKKNHEDYDLGRKYRNFYGTFPNFWLVDTVKYEKKKIEFLKRIRDEDESKTRGGKYKAQRDALIVIMSREGFSQTEIAIKIKGSGFDFTQRQVGMILKANARD